MKRPGAAFVVPGRFQLFLLLACGVPGVACGLLLGQERYLALFLAGGFGSECCLFSFDLGVALGLLGSLLSFQFALDGFALGPAHFARPGNRFTFGLTGGRFRIVRRRRRSCTELLSSAFLAAAELLARSAKLTLLDLRFFGFRIWLM